MNRWWENANNKFALAFALEDGGWFTQQDAIRYDKSPWLWQLEWEYFSEHGTMEGFEKTEVTA